MLAITRQTVASAARPELARVILELPDGTDVEVVVVRARGGQVALGFAAPQSVRIRRAELESQRAAPAV